MVQRLGQATIEKDTRTQRVLLLAAADAVSGGGGDHGALTGLDDDDHLHYVHRDVGREIRAQHTFAPVAAQAPFLLGTNAQGRLVTGLNADQWDGEEFADYLDQGVRTTDAPQFDRLGVGQAAAAGTAVNAYRQITGAATDNLYALKFTANHGSSGSPGYVYGVQGALYFNSSGGASNSGAGFFDCQLGASAPAWMSATGLRSYAQAYPGAGDSHSGAVAVDALANLGGAGGITDAVGVQGKAQATNGLISNAAALRALSGAVSGAGAIATLYGLKVEDQTVGGTNYAIYTGLGNVRLGDATTIAGSGAADVQLTVKGAASQSAHLQEWQTNAGAVLASIDQNGNVAVAGVASHLVATLPDTYDLGSSTKMWRKGWLSELEAVLFVEQAVSLLGGWFVIGHNAGTLAADLPAALSVVDFGKTMTVGDFVLFRSSLQVEYMLVGSLVSGTRYNVTRNLDGSGANNWYAGQPFLVLGASGDGRIELNAYDTPRIQLIRQGATYNAQTELVRIGDLNGGWGYAAEKWGLALGEYASGKNNLVLDQDGAFKLRNHATERIAMTAAGILTIKDSGGAAVFTFDAGAGAEFTKPLTLGSGGGIYQGSGSFASPTTGLKIWNDSGVGRIGGFNGGTAQWWATTDGTLAGAGGYVEVDENALWLYGGGYRLRMRWSKAEADREADLYLYSSGANKLTLSQFVQGEATPTYWTAMDLSTTNEGAVLVVRTSWGTLHSIQPDGDTVISGSSGHLRVKGGVAAGGLTSDPPTGAFVLKDGISAPSAIAGFAVLYVDTADGDLKVKFGDGTTKTIATDS